MERNGLTFGHAVFLVLLAAVALFGVLELRDHLAHQRMETALEQVADVQREQFLQTTERYIAYCKEFPGSC